MTRSGCAAGPRSHYELFAGLRDGGVAYLVAGATALVLHGVPRLTADLDLLLDRGPANLERLERLLGNWGYGEAAGAGAIPRRFRNPQSALGEIDAVPLASAAFARLQAGSAVVTLVDVGIPFVGAADLLALKAESTNATDREDAEALSILASIRAGETGNSDDTRREQIRKFSRWSVAARLDWVLAAARLNLGLPPEAKPMTRGLRRKFGR